VQAASATHLKKNPVTETIKTYKMQTAKKTVKERFKRIGNIALFLTGLATGYSFCHLFNAAHHRLQGIGKTDAAIPAAIRPSVLQNEVAATQKETDRQVAVAEKKNGELKRELDRTATALQKAKEKTVRLQSQLYVAIEQWPQPEPYSGDYGETVSLPATDNMPAILDSLVSVNGQKDSLCQNMTANLGLQLTVKDSIIAAKDRNTLLLKGDFETSIAAQQFFRDENRKLEKKLRRQRLGGKIKSAGLFILSGLALKSILH
jgi:hypothetical protein